jgi:hypothetical protein
VTLSNRRLGGSGRALDVTALRALVQDDGKVHLQRGKVWIEGGGSHYELVEEGGQVVDVLVDVQIMPQEIPVTCRLGGLGGGPGCGMWAIPPVGAEVIVGVPRGELAAGCVILAVESSQEVPDGLGPTTYVVAVPAGGQLLVHDGTASHAVPLATLADLQALRDYVDAQFRAVGGHTHVCAVPGQPTTAIACAPLIAPPSPPAPPPEGASVPVPNPSGTSVLKGK